MKRILVVILSCMFLIGMADLDCPEQVLAGTYSGPTQPKGWGGLRIGISSSTLIGRDAKGADLLPRIVFSPGMYWGIRLGHNFDLQTGIGLLAKGASERFPSTDGRNSGSRRMDLGFSYLEFPLLFKLNLPSGTNPRVHLLAGPVIGFNLAGRLTDVSGRHDISDRVRRLETALSVGIGIKFAGKQARRGSVFEIRYTQGLQSVLNQAPGGGPPADIRNSTLTFGINFEFGTKAVSEGSPELTLDYQRIGHNASFWIQKGDVAYYEKRYEGALAYYHEAVRNDYADASAWQKLGVTFYQCGYKQQALDCLTRALELDPAKPSLQQWMAAAVK